MLSDRLRERLAELNRQPLPVARESALRAAAATKPVARPLAPATPPASDVFARYGSEIETPQGKHLLIKRPISEIWDQADAFLADAGRRFSTAIALPQPHPDWQSFARRFPGQCIFLDLETCGFAGSMVFLVGVIHEDDNALVLSQLLARNYAEEPAMLCSLWKIMQMRGVLLSFNGKSFDWPMVTDRSVLHRLDVAGQTRALDLHIDLLHHARRRYRRELPNCKLQTLERFLCGRFRAGDIPGSEIPDAYHHYVRTGETAEMKSILHHNALDLITLLQLSLRFATS